MMFLFAHEFYTKSRKRRQTIGTFIVAFESDVGEDSLRKWVQTEMGSPAGICVINSNGGALSIFEQIITPKPQQIELQKATDPEDFDPLLTFVGSVYRWLYFLLLTNSTMSDLEQIRFWETRATWIWEGYLSEYLFEHLQKYKTPL
jgi:hypothetical protein